MKEFSAQAFATDFKNALYNALPNENELSFSMKHRKRGVKMRDLALGGNPIMPILDKGYAFELGNTQAEVKTPQYHILEDAEVIRKKGKGTKQSRGSQSSLAPQNRNYGQWTLTRKVSNGKVSLNAFQEYRKNVRGERSRISKATRRASVFNYNGKRQEIWINTNSPYYENVHYHYIEKALDGGMLDKLANEYGLKRGRTRIDIREEIAEAIGENNAKIVDTNAISQMLANSPTYKQ